MSNEETTQNGDDVYVIEDTGESLEDYTPEVVSMEPVEPKTEDSGAQSEELRSLKDQLLRSRADFDNYRKRLDREKDEFKRYALSRQILELLPVVDNFERALAVESGGSDFRIGVEMIYKQMTDALTKAGLREVEAGGVFDPTMHEAVMREETSDVPSHTILQTLQKGYFLNDRLIRPAMVKVAVGGPEPSSPSEGQA